MLESPWATSSLSESQPFERRGSTVAPSRRRAVRALLLAGSTGGRSTKHRLPRRRISSLAKPAQMPQRKVTARGEGTASPRPGMAGRWAVSP